MMFTGESEDDLPYDPSFDDHAVSHDLGPGDMVTWPQNTPHRVENLEGLNVSLTTEHYDQAAVRKRTTYLANHYLRRWFRLPTTSTNLSGLVPSLKRATYRVARRFPLPKAEVFEDSERFQLDDE